MGTKGQLHTEAMIRNTRIKVLLVARVGVDHVVEGKRHGAAARELRIVCVGFFIVVLHKAHQLLRPGPPRRLCVALPAVYLEVGLLTVQWDSQQRVLKPRSQQRVLKPRL